MTKSNSGVIIVDPNILSSTVASTTGNTTTSTHGNSISIGGNSISIGGTSISSSGLSVGTSYVGNPWTNSNYASTNSYTTSYGEMIQTLENKVDDLIAYLKYKGVTVEEDYDDFVESRKVLKKLVEAGENR